MAYNKNISPDQNSSEESQQHKRKIKLKKEE